VNEFKNANTLAHAVNDSLGAPFVPRPFNRFSPDESPWWLVGNADWPAYKHGKLFFVSRREQMPARQNGVYCGFNVEKGLGRRVAGLYPKELIEGDDWAWERFTASISAEFPALPLPQYVSVAVSQIPPDAARYGDSPESFLAQKESFRASQADFTLDARQQLRLLSMDVNQNSAEIAQHFGTKIRAAASLSALLADLCTFPQSDWSWVDLYIGTVVRKGPVGKLWNNCLKPWSGWVGTGRPICHGRS
jgi:hypothetical protein